MAKKVYPKASNLLAKFIVDIATGEVDAPKNHPINRTVIKVPSQKRAKN
jgi:hypothetical protein